MSKKINKNQKQLKILIINYEFPPLGGGGGVASYDLAVEWAKYGQVDVLTSSFKGLSKKEKVEGINIYRSKVLFRKSRDAASFLSMLTYLMSAFFKGISLARKNKYDIINTHFAIPSGPLGYIISKFFKIPNVLSIHGGDIYDPSKSLSPHKNILFKRVVKFILNRADRIVAQSSNTRDNAIKYYSPKKEVEIIPLAFHAPDKPKLTRKDLKIEKNEIALCAVGRIVKRKALDVIINAIKFINNKNIKFYIMGDGPERENLEKLVEKQNLQNNIKFLGFVSTEEKYSYIQAADLFTLTSLHEGFGIVYMEAMFFGLPIVCTNHGGQVDFLKHEENALLIDVNDVKACANSIERFINDKALYKKCSKNNKEKIKLFYADNVSKQYENIFLELVGEKCE